MPAAIMDSVSIPSSANISTTKKTDTSMTTKRRNVVQGECASKGDEIIEGPLRSESCTQNYTSQKAMITTDEKSFVSTYLERQIKYIHMIASAFIIDDAIQSSHYQAKETKTPLLQRSYLKRHPRINFKGFLQSLPP
ncbi:hypothetical protein EYC80_002151 [Monilinia laxa]|uniref:Uncharacterized protein n=1 Tax=Monilinia laxa TaxID=61186 RepID=A0A5N6K2Y5_MONLA|nr:hypothetical protein EYC80_002151 [Monilinia laxa]